jgi:hypothetical protein
MGELPNKRTHLRQNFEVTQSKDSFLMALPNVLKSVESTGFKAVSISNFSIEEIVSQKKKEKMR